MQSFLKSPEQSPPPCGVCGSTERYLFPYPSLRLPFRHLQVHACGQCGAGWVPPHSFDLARYYREEYASENRKDRTGDPETYFRDLEQGRGNQWYYGRAKRHAQHVGLLGRPAEAVLELGSGPGYFLHALACQQGGIPTAYAVEPDASSAKFLDYLGVKRVEVTDIPSLSPLDAVCASHSLEHFWLTDLDALVATLCRSLASDGLFVAEVPLGTLLRHSLHYQHDPHTVFFTYDAMETILRRAGFETVRMTCSNTGRLKPRKDAVYQPKAWKELDGMGSIVAIATKVPDDRRVLDATLVGGD